MQIYWCRVRRQINRPSMTKKWIIMLQSCLTLSFLNTTILDDRLFSFSGKFPNFNFQISKEGEQYFRAVICRLHSFHYYYFLFVKSAKWSNKDSPPKQMVWDEDSKFIWQEKMPLLHPVPSLVCHLHQYQYYCSIALLHQRISGNLTLLETRLY